MEITYEEDDADDVMNGEVQGKGDVASLWCLMSHTILEAHTDLHKPITMMGATNKVVVQKNNDAFVDDTDGYAEAVERGDNAEEEAIKSLQEKAQSWAKLIAVLGGSIAFNKCIWQVIGWYYKVSPPRMKEKSHYKIELTDREGMKTEIQQLPKDQPNIGLGCRLAMDGSQMHECAFRIQQCKQFHSRINAAALTVEKM